MSMHQSRYTCSTREHVSTHMHVYFTVYSAPMSTSPTSKRARHGCCCIQTRINQYTTVTKARAFAVYRSIDQFTAVTTRPQTHRHIQRGTGRQEDRDAFVCWSILRNSNDFSTQVAYYYWRWRVLITGSVTVNQRQSTRTSNSHG